MIIDQRGQISIEFVLVLAIMAVIVIAIGSYASESSEQSIISSAVRSAAGNATTSLSLLNSTTPLSVEDISNVTNGSNITLYIDFSGPVSTYQNQTILSSILSSMASQGYTVTNNSIITSRHTYTLVPI